MLERFINWLREPWLTQTRAMRELAQLWPNCHILIDPRGNRVRVYRNHVLMTNRPTLKQAMDRIRRFYSR